MNGREPIRIEIEEEPAFVPDNLPGWSGRALALGRRATRAGRSAASKIWRSRLRRRVTGDVKRGAGKAAVKGSRLARDIVIGTAERQARRQTATVRARLKETNWRASARARSASGLRWLGRRLGDLSNRINPLEKRPLE